MDLWTVWSDNIDMFSVDYKRWSVFKINFIVLSASLTIAIGNGCRVPFTFHPLFPFTCAHFSTIFIDAVEIYIFVYLFRFSIWNSRRKKKTKRRKTFYYWRVWHEFNFRSFLCLHFANGWKKSTVMCRIDNPNDKEKKKTHINTK